MQIEPKQIMEKNSREFTTLFTNDLSYEHDINFLNKLYQETNTNIINGNCFIDYYIFR